MKAGAIRHPGETREVRLKAALFDLDGTLLDSAPDLVASLNAVRKMNGLPDLPLEEMQPFASAGAVGLLNAGMPQADEATLQRWRTQFLEFYAENSLIRSSLFEGVPELLEGLLADGIGWGLVTNKPAYLTGPILEHFGLAKGVGSVVCGDTIKHRKPHAAPVLRACHELASRPEEVIFLGDDVRDLKAGRAAGTIIGAAHYGYGATEFARPENLQYLNGSVSISEPLELLAWARAVRT